MQQSHPELPLAEPTSPKRSGQTLPGVSDNRPGSRPTAQREPSRWGTVYRVTVHRFAVLGAMILPAPETIGRVLLQVDHVERGQIDVAVGHTAVEVDDVAARRLPGRDGRVVHVLDQLASPTT